MSKMIVLNNLQAKFAKLAAPAPAKIDAEEIAAQFKERAQLLSRTWRFMASFREKDLLHVGHT
jgi:hypothetical protein